MSDLYVSYSPTDTEFVAQLLRELARHQIAAYDPHTSGDRSQEVANAISNAQAMLFVVRPESLRCPDRNAELELAFSQNKRVIPVVREDPADAPVPDRLAAVKWIPAEPEHGLPKAIERVVHTVLKDLRAGREHRAALIRTRRRRLRESFQPRWNEAREPLLALIALSALVLGTIGYLHAKQGFNLLDSFYRALQLYGFGGAVSYKVPLTLQIARVLAPFALGFAAVRGIFHLFGDELQVLRIRLLARDHVVVVGLGEAGVHMVKSFYDEGWKVVAVERDPASPRLAAARDLGVPVLIGDAREPGPLRRARLARARYLLIVGGDDGINFDIAMAAADHVASRRRGELTAFVHIRDLRLWRGLKARAAAAVEASPVRLEVFNVYFTAAHLMVDKLPPFEDGEGNELKDPHVSLVGLDGVGEGLALRIASTWRERHPDRKLRLTVAGPSADAALHALLTRYPAIGEICQLGARPMEIDTAEFARGGVLLDANGECDVTKAYVALDSQGDSLTAAFGLHGAAATADVPVVVALNDDESGTARALAGAEGSAFAHGVQPFGVMSSALTPAIALQGMTELIARQRHAEWMRKRLAEGKPSDATVPWEQLREEYKEANRHFADGIGVALTAVGCALAPAPLSDPAAARFTFSAAEIETLGRLEHERWMEEMTSNGWHWGDQKNLAKHTHPHLVPWDQLPPDVQESDRETMRDLPRFLAAASLELYRPNVTVNGQHNNGNPAGPTRRRNGKRERLPAVRVGRVGRAQLRVPSARRRPRNSARQP